jgi:O-antigen/teichoic acid export membrane protein
VREAIVNLLAFCYRRIFAEELTANIKIFLRNLGYVAFGFGIAKILTVIFNILAGRFLGPAGYGKFTLVTSVAMFLSLPMFCGITTAMVKYTAEEDNFERRSSIITTAYLMVFVFAAVSTAFYLIFQAQFLRFFAIPKSIFHLALFFTLIYMVSTIAMSTLQGLQKIKKRSILEVIFGVSLLGVFILFVLTKSFRSFGGAVFALSIAYASSAVAGVISIRRYFSASFDSYWAKRLIRYGFYSLLAAVSFTFLAHVDKVMINKYLVADKLGLYRAYYASSLGMVSSVVIMFTTVFFPAASRSRSKWKIFERINRFIPYLIGLGLPVLIAGEFIALKLYGRDYPIDPLLLILFGLGAIVIFLYGAYDWLMASVGRRGIRVCMIAITFSALLNIVLNRILIPRVGITGAIAATILSYLVALFFLISQKNVLKGTSNA